MLVPPTEPSIIANNQPAMTVVTGVIQAPQALKTPAKQEFIVCTTPYNTGANRTTCRFIRTEIDGYILAAIGSGTSFVAIRPSPTPHSFYIWNGRIVNIGQTNTPSFRETSGLHASIDIILSNDLNAPSAGSQILYDEFSVKYGSNI